MFKNVQHGVYIIVLVLYTYYSIIIKPAVQQKRTPVKINLAATEKKHIFELSVKGVLPKDIILHLINLKGAS